MTEMRISISDLNRRNEEFWAKQNALMMERLADEVLAEIAFSELAYERARGVPVYSQKSVERALEDVARARERFLAQQGKKGGKSKKTDALQGLIIDLARRMPIITEQELRDRLTREAYPEIIEDVDDETISFKTHKGRLKEAPITGLKDRLSRAKKKVNSR